MTFARNAIRGRVALVVGSALLLGGLLAQQAITRPAAHPHYFALSCMSEAHPEWGLHRCDHPGWSSADQK